MRSRPSIPVPESPVETFVPLYLTNECDGQCSLCNMSAANSSLLRRTGSDEEILHQLRILRHKERVSAVCLLTGEFSTPQRRKQNLRLLLSSIGAAFAEGFDKVYINAGSLTDKEIATIRRRFGDGTPPLVLSLFQESYDQEAYRRFVGDAAATPKADFHRRLSTPERWVKAGFGHVDIGVLLGIADPDRDIGSLIAHARALRELGADVAVSLPRVKGENPPPVPISDGRFRQIVRQVSTACPWARIIITTRESIRMIRELLPLVGIVSPGSSDVLPYTETGCIPNASRTSQFVVAPKRPRPSWVLRSLGLQRIRFFEAETDGHDTD